MSKINKKILILSTIIIIILGLVIIKLNSTFALQKELNLDTKIETEKVTFTISSDSEV